MSVVAANKCFGGAIIYADRRISFSDGSSDRADKIWPSNFPFGSIAIGAVTQNFHAAEGLVTRILKAINQQKPKTIQHLLDNAEGQLVRWSKPYQRDEPELGTELLLVTSFDGHVFIHRLQPRNTVREAPYKDVIGAGATLVKPILDDLMPDGLVMKPKAALMQMAFAIRQAKLRMAGIIGESSNAVFIPADGLSFQSLGRIELELAEVFAEGVKTTSDNLLRYMLNLDNKDVETTSLPYQGLVVSEKNRSKSLHFQTLKVPDYDEECGYE